MKDHVEMMEQATDKAGANGLFVNVATTLSKDQKAAMDEVVSKAPRKLRGGPCSSIPRW
jgi:hypothetical protein